jgi:hypothetical protein
MDMDASLLVLHGLAVRKSGTVEQIALVTGQDADLVRATLDEGIAAGEVLGARDVYMPTPAGRSRLDGAYATTYGDVRADERFRAAADRFESVNKKLLALLTSWQSVSRAGTNVPNDHSDPAYDAKILDELGELHERTEPLLETLAGQVPRYRAYLDRLAAAYDRALGGADDFVSGVRVDSYHTVWHELHEDLLRVLGRSREE